MKLEKLSLLLFCLTLCFLSCNNDDDDGGSGVPIRDRGEQQITDKGTLTDYFKNHYYNKSSFEGNTNPTIADIEIKEVLEGDNISSDADSLLINAVETHTTSFADTDYEYYILRLNQGGGTQSPSYADEVRALYEGFTLTRVVDNDTIYRDTNDPSLAFDSAVNPVDFDLTGTILGWGKVFEQFNTSGSGAIVNPDGTLSYTNNGLGVMFLPSGLAYFNSPRAGSGIGLYEPLIFKFTLLATEENDHDGDGIPSYLEDLDLNRFLLDDNTDEDFTVVGNSRTPLYNYTDADDDGDGISTADEIKDLFEITEYDNRLTKADVEAIELASNEKLVAIKKELNGTYTGITITSTDTDGDGILDYLDSE